MMRVLKALSVGATLMMYLVLQMGALVTNTGSGNGCGANWPLCKGSFLPEFDYAAAIEFSHRAVTGLATILLVAVLVGVWWKVKRPLVRWMVSGAFFFLVVQALLGAAAVLWPQPKAVLALHFGISLICFSLTLLTTVLLFRPETGAETASADAPALLRRWTWFVVGYNYIVIYLGAYVRHMKATPACQGWPLCNGQLIPPLYGLTGVNFIHRLAAGMAVVLVIRMALMAVRLAPARRDLHRAAWVAVAFVLLQVVSGAVMAVGYLNLATQMTHTALITIYWGAVSYMALGVEPRKVAAKKMVDSLSVSGV